MTSPDASSAQCSWFDRGRSLALVDGQTWREVPITAPGTLISWSIWSYQWTPEQEGDVTLLVRVVDARGEPQIETFRDQVPHGATGLHRVRGAVEKA